ncbi:MAG: molybdenum cofactor biosynthesis protein MoaE [Rhodomicrobium sp.]|jgi:molybdopterin synthase catalytic subunit
MIRVQEQDFDIGAEIAALRKGRTDVGAIASFIGTVRGEGGGLAAMTLEHYPGMTENELERIEAEARSRWPLLDCLIVHRAGRLLPGDNIVLAVTLSAHRRAAFEAVEFLMDYLKARAPFWKSEESGAHRSWVAARESDDADAARWKIR